jgi:predicted nucleic acid-binding protein
MLIDTSFFVALTFPKDRNHALATEARDEMRGERMVIAPVLQELFFVVTIRMNYQAAINAFRRARSSPFTVVDLIEADMARMDEIMQQYQDAALDFVDVAQMAVSERLDIRQIYTFDHRDFRLFRPRHCDYLDLLP